MIARRIVKETTASHPGNSVRRAGWVLVLEPAEEVAAEIVAALKQAAPDAHVEVTRSLEEAQQRVLDAKPDLFVLDVDATYDLGQEFLYDLRTSHPNARAIILTAIHLAEHREQAKGLGAIHFLEKPFPRADFVDLAQALLDPSSKSDSEKFQGTLSDLHIADIIQLKCMSGATSALEFTGPRGERARVFFENGQVRHATAPRKEGVDAFNEIVNWKGGRISEVSGAGRSPRTIDLDWQVLLMEAVRKIDETRDAVGSTPSAAENGGAANSRKILVIDDSLMLLSFVNEILTEANYQVTTAAMAEEGLRVSVANPPDLILLDYILPDMKGNEVSRRLATEPQTKEIPVLYMSGLGTDLVRDQIKTENVIGFLNKPFTSETLLKTIEKYMSKAKQETESTPGEMETAQAEQGRQAEVEDVREVVPEFAPIEPEESAPSEETTGDAPPWWSESTAETETTEEFAPSAPEPFASTKFAPTETESADSGEDGTSNVPIPDGEPFFSGDTNFFSLHWALQTIAKEKLTGALRCFWQKESVELLAQKGRIKLVTTRDPDLYCPEAPITLVNVDAERIVQARAQQNETGCPLFITLAREGLIIREPAVQLVQHYGQKLFAQLWTARRVRFVFELSAEVPDYAREVPAEDDVDQWSLATLRFIQYNEVEQTASYDPGCIPGYTRDGFERVQNLRLTVAEAQFASQFNGIRSLQQIAKNLRLDLKFARLTLFRFLALEIVECWPAGAPEKPQRRGLLQRFGFGG